jgi:hypothetical protein
MSSTTPPIQTPRVRIMMLVVLSALLLVSGCLSRRQVVYQEMDSANTGSGPRTIAILPFQDATGTPGLSQMVRQSLYGHLSHRRFKDVELTVVDQALTDPGPPRYIL